MNATKPTRALARGLEVIQILNERSSTPMSLLSERTGMSRATLLRILKTLDAAGWIYRYRADSNYRLTSEVCHLGQHLLTVDRIAEQAAPILDRLYEAVGWPSDIAVYTGQHMRILDSTRRAHPEIGNHNPLDAPADMLWSALGRVYLAFCTVAEREAILERLRHSHKRCDQAAHNPQWVEDLLEETRAQGYAVAERGCYERRLNRKLGLDAIAVPVGNHEQPRACLSLIWIEGEDCLDRIAGELLPALRAAAEEIADSLRRHEAKDAP